MRRWVVLIVAVAVAASMAGAAHASVAKTSGAVSLQLKDGAGLAKVRNRGTFFGRVRRGKIVATPNVHVNGCESRGETNGNMIRCKGREITFYTCTACHGVALIKAQGMSRELWDQSFDLMLTRHRMPPVKPGSRTSL